ncbi:hypothetical protein ACFQ1I_42095 [Kitasatospora arboriphila]
MGTWLQLESRETLTRLGSGAAERPTEVPVLRLDDGTGAEAVAALLLPEFFDGDRLDRRRLAAAAVAGRPLTSRPEQAVRPDRSGPRPLPR